MRIIIVKILWGNKQAEYYTIKLHLQTNSSKTSSKYVNLKQDIWALHTTVLGTCYIQVSKVPRNNEEMVIKNNL